MPESCLLKCAYLQSCLSKYLFRKCNLVLSKDFLIFTTKTTTICVSSLLQKIYNKVAKLKMKGTVFQSSKYTFVHISDEHIHHKGTFQEMFISSSWRHYWLLNLKACCSKFAKRCNCNILTFKDGLWVSSPSNEFGHIFSWSHPIDSSGHSHTTRKTFEWNRALRSKTVRIWGTFISSHNMFKIFIAKRYDYLNNF